MTEVTLDTMDTRILDIIQTDFPLEPRPYALRAERRGRPPWPAPCGNLAGALPRQRVTAGSLSRQHRPREWDSLRKAPPRGWKRTRPTAGPWAAVPHGSPASAIQCG